MLERRWEKRVSELEAIIREQNEQIASLTRRQKEQDQLAAQQGAAAEEMAKKFAAMGERCGNCRSPAQGGSACIACYAPCAQPAPSVLQPEPCAWQPRPCATGCEVPCQPPVATCQASPVTVVQGMTRTMGELRIRNEMGSGQSLLVNGVDRYYVQPHSMQTVPVPSGTATTELAGERMKSWPIAAPNYSQEVIIVPAVRLRPETRVVARPIEAANSPRTPTAQPSRAPARWAIVDDGGRPAAP